MICVSSSKISSLKSVGIDSSIFWDFSSSSSSLKVSRSNKSNSSSSDKFDEVVSGVNIFNEDISFSLADISKIFSSITGVASPIESAVTSNSVTDFSCGSASILLKTWLISETGFTFWTIFSSFSSSIEFAKFAASS